MKVLVTGGNGFIGKSLLKAFQSESYQLAASVRVSEFNSLGKTKFYTVGNIDGSTDWSELLESCSVVVHTSGVSSDENIDKNDDYFIRTNVDASLNLLKQSIENGVKKFIFLSSIKVNGENTHGVQKFHELDKTKPKGIYAISKYMAEQGIMNLAHNSNIEIYILRLPIVYGAGADNNFMKLVESIRSSYIFPCFSKYNLRSYLGIDNLIDFIKICIERNPSEGKLQEIFLLSDLKPLSTCEVIRTVKKVFDTKVYLLPIPDSLVNSMLKLLGKDNLSNKIYGNLIVDITKAKKILAWEPKKNMQQQLRKII